MAEYLSTHTGAELDAAISKVNAGYIDTSDATAAAANILSGKTAYVNGSKVTGTIPSVAAKTVTPSAAAQTAVGAGSYCAGTVSVAAVANLAAANIKYGATVGGVAGNFSSDATATAANILSGKTAYVKGSKVTGTIPSIAAKTVTPSAAAQTAVGAGNYCAGAVTVAAVANLAAGNIKSGVTLGGVAGTFTSDATAAAASILSGKTAYVKGAKVTGTYAPVTIRTVVKTGTTITAALGASDTATVATGLSRIIGLSIAIRMNSASLEMDVGVCSLVVGSPDIYKMHLANTIPMVWLDSAYNMYQDFANNAFVPTVSGGNVTIDYFRSESGQYPAAQSLTFELVVTATGY